MPEAKATSTERLADQFVSYLFDEYQGTRHVRRVATWIGFLLKAIESIAPEINRSRSRQIKFEYGNRKFKARYNHQAGSRGGIDIIEILPGRGEPDGELALRITSLDEAEYAYRNLKSELDSFLNR